MTHTAQRGVCHMNKKQQILKTAMHLFAQKGFHFTSMQEIAEQTGVAKGSIYTYFRSKEELLLSILQQHYAMMQQNLQQVEEEPGLTNKEIFRRQISVQLKVFTEHRDFILVHLREQALYNNEEIRQFVFQKTEEFLIFLHERIIQLFGEQISPFAMDCALIFHAMLKEYAALMIMTNHPIAIDELTSFLMNRLENIVEGSLVDQKSIVQHLTNFQMCMTDQEKVLSMISNMEQILTNNVSQIEEKKFTSAMESLQTMKDHQNDDQIIIFEGLLLYLQNLNIPQINESLQQLIDFTKKTTSSSD